MVVECIKFVLFLLKFRPLLNHNLQPIIHLSDFIINNLLADLDLEIKASMVFNLHKFSLTKTFYYFFFVYTF